MFLSRATAANTDKESVAAAHQASASGMQQPAVPALQRKETEEEIVQRKLIKPKEVAGAGRPLQKKSSPVQRVGGNGLPRDITVAAGTLLTHGTLVYRFDPYRLDRAGPGLAPGNPLLPTAPAWFAANPVFSIHAAARFIDLRQNGTVYVHAYQVGRPLKLIAYEDVADMSVLVNQLDQGGPIGENNVPAAIRVERATANYDGYQVDADLVRGEREFILFDSGIRKLQPYVISALNVVPSGEDKHDLSGMGGSEFKYDRSGGGPGDLYMTK